MTRVLEDREAPGELTSPAIKAVCSVFFVADVTHHLVARRAHCRAGPPQPPRQSSSTTSRRPGQARPELDAIAIHEPLARHGVRIDDGELSAPQHEDGSRVEVERPVGA